MSVAMLPWVFSSRCSQVLVPTATGQAYSLGSSPNASSHCCAGGKRAKNARRVCKRAEWCLSYCYTGSEGVKRTERAVV